VPLKDLWGGGEGRFGFVQKGIRGEHLKRGILCFWASSCAPRALSICGNTRRRRRKRAMEETIEDVILILSEILFFLNFYFLF
jgi:hypothetical protein